jgi:hypothetical protein
MPPMGNTACADEPIIASTSFPEIQAISAKVVRRRGRASLRRRAAARSLRFVFLLSWTVPFRSSS